MRCDICGSKKNVRMFYAPMRMTFYTECRKCFEKAFILGSKMSGIAFTAENMEKEWESGGTSLRQGASSNEQKRQNHNQ